MKPMDVLVGLDLMEKFLNRHIKTHLLILIEMFLNVAFLRISKEEILILFEHLLEVLLLGLISCSFFFSELEL